MKRIAPLTDACIRAHRPFAYSASAETSFDAMSFIARKLEHDKRRLAAEVRRLTDFLEGICICEGPAAAAFTAQQLDRIRRARKLLKSLKEGA